MRSDPKPYCRIFLQNAYCAPVNTDTYRADRLTMVNPLESQRWVPWIFLPALINFARMSTDIRRQLTPPLAEGSGGFRNHGKDSGFSFSQDGVL